MADRSAILGFEPQKESPYNKLLPYADKLDKESNEQLADIKAYLAKTIQLRDLKIGTSHWTGQLTKYIRLYGLKFSKRDHIHFINILFELAILPDLEYSLVQKYASLLINLLKKKELLSRDDLVLPWQPLHRLIEGVAYSRYEHHGLVLLPSNIETVLKNLVRVARIYFPVEATQEMLDEWRPLMCPFDVTMGKAMYYFELFLPTLLPTELHDKSIRLWFEEMIGLWDACQNSSSWEANLVGLFARLALDCIGHIDWEPYMSKIFTRILRSLNLPVGSSRVQVSRNGSTYEINQAVNLMIGMMGGGSSAQGYIEKMFTALESFFHPSNYGKWTTKLLKLTHRLPNCLVRRLHRERYESPSWESPVPDSYKLTDDEVTRFVKSMLPTVSLAMFSKQGSHSSAMALQQLAVLRPELVIPPMMEDLYPALETLIEPHRLIACLHCTVSVGRPMLGSPRWYPEGRLHILPLLNLCLPGIDPNDVKKCLITFQLVSTLISLIPVVDCSGAVNVRSDLSPMEVEICAATAQFEDFVLQFLDRIFSLIENSTHEHTRSDSNMEERLTHEEAMLEVGLLSTFNAIVQQSSAPIFKLAVERVFRFVSSNVMEIRVAGRFTSDLVRAAAKVNAEYTMKTFLKYFAVNIRHRAQSEDLREEEHLDNEFLWNLKHLSELVRSDGCHLLPYREDLCAVLRDTLHLRCPEAAELSGNLLRHLLRALSHIYTLDYRSTTNDWNRPLVDGLPIRDWGVAGDLDHLDLKWHIPSASEKEFATELLQSFLVPVLDRIRSHAGQEQDLTREKLKQHLSLVVHCLMGAGSALPAWNKPPVKLIESMVELKRFNNTASTDVEGISLSGQNVRQMIADTMRPLLEHMLKSTEDDTKSLIQLIKIYSCLIFYHGTQKNDFDDKWKSLHVVKKSMENKLVGKKKHIRALLVDRAQLQHELRVVNKSARTFSETHRDIFHDLFRLSISRYSEVRKVSQSVLDHGFLLYAYSYRSLLPDILQCLLDKPENQHHHFKGALFLILGKDRRCMLTKRSWEVMIQTWPAVIQAQHSEKPSILKLMDSIMEKLQKNVETAELSIQCSEGLLEKCAKIYSESSIPHPSVAMVTKADLAVGALEEQKRNTECLKMYHELVDTLVTHIESGTMLWKFQQLTMEMLTLLIRHDVPLPARATHLFTKQLVDNILHVRKICISSLSAILKQHKRRHKTRAIDPYAVSGCERPQGGLPQPGVREDNKWHLYSGGEDVYTSQETWNQAIFIEKTHWGYYCWPKPMLVYAPESEQPPLNRSLTDMQEEERVIAEHFLDPDFISKLINFLTLEENKGKDKFHSKHFTLFKGLFRNYGDSLVPLLRPHVERLVADNSPETHECNQRAAAEIISGLIRGSKHWGYSKSKAMWAWLVPVLKTALGNLSVECVQDWGTCFATASESQDPRRLSPLLNLLMTNPLSGEGGSFGDSSRLYILQGAIAQQEWRVPQLLHQLLAYLSSHMLHPYKSIRDRLGSVLVNIFLYDITVPNCMPTTSPRQTEFIRTTAFPQLHLLLELQESSDSKESVGNGRSHVMISDEDACELNPTATPMAVDDETDLNSHPDAEMECAETPEGSTGLDKESEERKNAIKICKTVMKWLQGSLSRMLQCVLPDIYQFLPILCGLVSETKDDELRKEAEITLACMAQIQLQVNLIPSVLAAVKQVSEMSSWHARAAILGFTQVMVFCNFFLLKVPDVVVTIRGLVIHLLCDEQLEVREMAAITLGGLLHCRFLTIDEDLLKHFRKLGSTKVGKHRHHGAASVSAARPERLLKRHAGVLGLSACVQAFPYDVPEFIPQVLMLLSEHLDDPQPIQLTVKKALSNFKRTHHDSWHDHKRKFTDDQLVVLTDLLVSPNYYA